MYQLVKAVGLSRSIGSQWADVDLSQILVYNIFATYTKVFLVLTNDALPEGTQVYVDLDSLRTEFSSYQDTLTNLLIELGDRTLITVDTLPSTQTKFARYADAIRSRYKIELTNIGTVVPDNYPKDDLHDLMLTRPTYETDMAMLHSHCLVSVNGYFHRTDTDGNKAYIYKGADSMRQSKINHVGILSFLDLGAVTKIPLTANNIQPQSVGSTLKERIYFSVDEAVGNRSAILVLGGYLVFPSENVFWRNGENSFALDINQIPYIERIYESSIYLDLSDLQLTEEAINPEMINTAELYSDDVIRRYMTLSQSFLVLIDIPNLVTNKIHLRRCDMPGMFTAYQEPTYPLVVNYGKLAEYWKTKEDGHWSVNVADSFMRNYILTNQPIANLPNVNNHLDPMVPFRHSRGYLLEISGWQS